MKLYLVETKDEVFWSTEKIDAIYKHVEYPYGKARYKEVDRSKYQFPDGKKKVKLQPALVEV